MSRHQLAQLNIATLLAPIDSPEIADFVANLAPVNRLAEASPGFVWRLQDEAGDATHIASPWGPEVIVNMSVWQDIAALHGFAFRNAEHVAVVRRRREWFQRMVQAYAVLWWVPEGHRPTVHEAAERLEHLRAHGPTARAFTFRESFPAPDASTTVSDTFDDLCPAT
jgi:hypothetical protein